MSEEVGMTYAADYFAQRFADPAWWRLQAEIAERIGELEEAAKCRKLAGDTVPR